MQYPYGSSGNQTSDLPVCSTARQCEWKGMRNYSKLCLEDGGTLFVADFNGLLHVQLDEAGCNNVVLYGLQGAA
jgi:hypothetical protein